MVFMVTGKFLSLNLLDGRTLDENESLYFSIKKIYMDLLYCKSLTIKQCIITPVLCQCV